MTTIKFNEHGMVKGIEIRGHADYSERGTDIVCAAISALSQTYKFYMEDLYDNGKADIISITMINGYFEMVTENTSVESRAAFDMIKQGFEAISETYPENVKVFSKKL